MLLLDLNVMLRWAKKLMTCATRMVIWTARKYARPPPPSGRAPAA